MALERTERHLPSEEGSEQGDHSVEGGEKRGKAGRGSGKGEDTKKAEPVRDSAWVGEELGVSGGRVDRQSRPAIRRDST